MLCYFSDSKYKDETVCEDHKKDGNRNFGKRIRNPYNPSACRCKTLKKCMITICNFGKPIGNPFNLPTHCVGANGFCYAEA